MTDKWQLIDDNTPFEVPVQIWDGKIVCSAICYKTDITKSANRRYWVAFGSSGFECENDFQTPLMWQPQAEPPK